MQKPVPKAKFPLAREFAVIEPRDSTYQLQETSGP
jgi:hypothetical protein